MTPGAIVMLVVGSAVLFGGLAATLIIAISARRRADDPASDSADDAASDSADDPASDAADH